MRPPDEGYQDRAPQHVHVVGSKIEPPAMSAITADALLIATLSLFNESDDIDATLQKCLGLLTAATASRVGEIWLRAGEARDVALEYTSSDGSPALVAFEAQGRSLGLGPGPAMVSRVVRTGRAASGSSTAADGWGDRADEASAAASTAR